MFKENDLVLYAGHGVCRILDSEIKVVDKKKVEYFVLEPVEQPGTRFYVPKHNATAVGKMRHILNKREIDALLQSVKEMEFVWIDDENQRKQKYRDVLSSVDHNTLICMMRSAYQHKLEQRDSGRKFHLCDEHFLRDAERLLISEFSCALSIDQKDVKQYMIEHIGVI